jgi:hypothetical protein
MVEGQTYFPRFLLREKCLRRNNRAVVVRRQGESIDGQLKHGGDANTTTATKTTTLGMLCE